MDDLLSEKEQIDQMRTWWSEYGAYVIGGIVVGAGLLFGINQYQGAREKASLDASSAYEALTEEVASGDLDKAEALAAEITAEYADTAYAGPTGLAMARLYMDKNRDQDAADTLMAVIDSTAADAVKNVARLRLARIYLYQEKAADVVALLEGQEVEAFSAPYNEVLGDAYVVLGRIEDARSAYQTVLLDPLAQGTVDSQLVQWKSLDLPEPASSAAAGESADGATGDAVAPSMDEEGGQAGEAAAEAAASASAIESSLEEATAEGADADTEGDE